LAKGEGERGARRPERGLTLFAAAEKVDCCCVPSEYGDGLSSGGMRRGDATDGDRLAERGVRVCVAAMGGMADMREAGADTAGVKLIVEDSSGALE